MNAIELIEQVINEKDMQVRTFFDSGMLCFATLEDVTIESTEDNRVDIMCTVTNNPTWPHDHPIHELFDGYEGSLESLYDNFKQLVNLDAAIETLYV